MRGGRGVGQRHLVYLKIGTGIGAGIVSDGRLHRGAQGLRRRRRSRRRGPASGRRLLVREPWLPGGSRRWRGARPGGHPGRGERSQPPTSPPSSPRGGRSRARRSPRAAQHGDEVAVQLLLDCGRHVGEVLATIVNFYNPAIVLVGGGVAGAGDLLLAAIREHVYRRSLPLATRDLQIVLSPLADQAGLRGAAAMVTDELFGPGRIVRWLSRRTPCEHAGARRRVTHPPWGRRVGRPGQPTLSRPAGA